MTKIAHPSLQIDRNWIELIRERAVNAEKDRRLSSEVVDLIYKQNWLKILVPSAYGGAQLALPEVVKLEEALAWADGSLGWVVTLCAGAGWFGGFLDKGFAKKIFADDKVCLAGSGAATGTAEIIEGGYRVNGKWSHASGALIATMFTANCIITKDGIPVKDENGKDKILSFAFLKNEVRLIKDWNKMGMIATASYPYEVRNVTVPEDRCFKISSSSLNIQEPLYQFPFLQLAECTLAANICGIGIHFIDICEELFDSKQRWDKVMLIDDETVFATLQKAKRGIAEARENMYHALEHAWHDCTKFESIPGELLHMVTASSKNLVKTAREAVNELFPFCGLSATDTHLEINRVWRDFHTAAQHPLLVF